MWNCKEWWDNQLRLGNWCGSLTHHHLPPVRHQPHLLIPSAQNNPPGKNKEPRDEIELPTNRLVLPWAMHTEPRVRDLDLQPASKTGSDKINIEKQERIPKRKQDVL